MRSRAESLTPWLGLGAFVLLGLYLAFPDKVYVFDGIMFSDVIERNVDDWRKQVFNERHLLFIPVMMTLRDALARLGASVAAYPLIQRVNALVGAAALALYFRLLRRLVPERAAAAGALVLGLTAGFWSRACEGQVYMLMLFWSFSCALAALRLIEERTPVSALRLAAVLALASLFHAANVVLVPMAAAAALLAARRGARPGALVAAAGLCGLGIALPYAVAFRLKDVSGLVSFLTAATGSYTPGQVGSASGILTYFLSRDNPLAVLPSAAFQSAVAFPWAGPLPALAGGSLALGCAAAAARLWRLRPQVRPHLAVLCFWGAGYVALDAVWHGGVYFWTVPCAAALAVLLAAGDGPRLPVAAAALGLALGAWNLKLAVLPQSRLENNAGYQKAMFVRDHTLASSWIILSGFGFPNAKVYLPYFAHRTREALEYYLERYPREKALLQFSGFVANNLRNGIPMYLLSDMVEDDRVSELLARKWGVQKSDLVRCFGPGHVIEVAEQDPSFRVFLFAPREGSAALVAVLAYSVMTETDQARLAETIKVLRAISQSMTEPERRSLPAVLRASDYGAKLLLEGFAPFMSQESSARAEERVRTYDAFQKSPDFHLRIGNVYATFGLNAEARREWTAAYAATRDPRIAASLSRLPRP